MATLVDTSLLTNKSVPSLFKRVNYTASHIMSLKSISIREYDMKNAGLSMIKRYKLLPQSAIDKLEQLNKHDMNVAVGKLRKELPDFSKDLSNSIRITMIAFLIKNKIEESDILAIKNDAVFIIGKRASTVDINGGLFINKHSYTSYIKLNNIECYYNSKTNILDIKGIGSNVIEMAKDGIVVMLSKLLNDRESLNEIEFYKSLIKFRTDYVNSRLNYSVYREFGIGNGFRMDICGFRGNDDINAHQLSVFLPKASQELVHQIDKKYNYVNVVVPLFQALL